MKTRWPLVAMGILRTDKIADNSVHLARCVDQWELVQMVHIDDGVHPFRDHIEVLGSPLLPVFRWL